MTPEQQALQRIGAALLQYSRRGFLAEEIAALLLDDTLCALMGIRRENHSDALKGKVVLNHGSSDSTVKQAT